MGKATAERIHEVADRVLRKRLKWLPYDEWIGEAYSIVHDLYRKRDGLPSNVRVIEQVAYYHILNSLTRTPFKRVKLGVDLDELSTSDSDVQETQEHVQNALKKLPLLSQRIARAKWIQGMSNREIATALRLGQRQVDRLIANIKESLRQLLKP